MKKLLSFLMAFSSMQEAFYLTVRADLPINCKKSGGEVAYPGQIWSFHLSSEE